MSKKYLIAWGVSASLVAILSIVINLIVDPYGFYSIFSASGINQQKEGVRNKIRFVKALELPIRQPKTILMGSSRVHDGMNPSHPLLQEKAPVYNFAVDMNRIHETLILLKHAIRNSEVERVILGLDLFMFNGLQQTNHDFDESLIGEKVSAIDYLLPSILSHAALSDSYRTLKISHEQPQREEFLKNGYRPQAFYGIKNYLAAHYYTNWVFLTPRDQGTKYYNHIELNEKVFKDFEEILSICKKNQIDIRMYINPAHAHLDGEGLFVLGEWGLLENWKRRVSKISAAYNIPLWDFSGYNSVTTENVQNPMQYYWDSSHFTEKVGNWIIDRLFGKNNNAPSDFGVLITPENIEAHLSSIRFSRNDYVSKNKLDVQQIQADYKEIINGAPLDQSRLKDMY